jgi:O-antigen/teichoic acid export membrane protein
LKLNLFLSVFIQLVISISPLITAPYISRIFGETLVGKYSFDLSLVSYFSLFSLLGVNEYGVLAIAKVRDDLAKRTRVFWSIFFTKGIASLLCMAVYFALVSLRVLFDQSLFVFLFFGFELFGVFSDISFFYGGIEQYPKISLATFFSKVANVLLIFLFVKSKDDFIWYVLIMSCSTLGLQAFLWTLLPKNICKLSRFPSIERSDVKNCLLYFLPSIASSLYFIVDKTLLGLLISDGNASNGFYEQATKISRLIITAVCSVNAVMLSRMSYLYEKGAKDEMRDKEHKIMNLFALLAFPCCAGVCAISRYFVPLFFGEAFVGAVPYLYVLIFLSLLVPLSNLIVSIYYIPRNLLKIRTIYIVIGGLSNVAMDVGFIFLMGGIGACVASVISEFIFLFLVSFGARKELDFKQDFLFFIKPFIASVAMFVACWFSLDFFVTKISEWTAVIVTIVEGVAIYAMLLFLLKDSFVLEYTSLLTNKISKHFHQRKPR